MEQMVKLKGFSLKFRTFWDVCGHFHIPRLILMITSTHHEKPSDI